MPLVPERESEQSPELAAAILASLDMVVDQPRDDGRLEVTLTTQGVRRQCLARKWFELAAQPVSRNMVSASCSVRMSPLPTTGIESTASTTARIPSRFTRPPNPCSRVRPWTITAAAPTRSNDRARPGADLLL